MVQYCVNHDRNYKTTASVFNVSYSQVYSWTRSYKG
ncbi:MAG: helix-turn-helix domain-containing protein [Clostridium sulfidigenes]|uniref:Helix-turn-helix domain-containing protein n=1 Tax=Clostridium sulfidigenes TaxID=318464 RepID=A0A927ZIJ6_9CLOT|nr:helix-turn-helix domain-containing protein [Clostridium sulfidigenes]